VQPALFVGLEAGEKRRGRRPTGCRWISVGVLLPPSVMAAIVSWAARNGKKRAPAIRELILSGLDRAASSNAEV
jgi:hypothetical protein